MPRTYTKGTQELIDKARADSIRFVGIDGDGCQAPGAIIIHKGSSLHPFVVHFANTQCGGYHYGDYCKTLAEAEVAMAEKVRRYDPDGTRRANFNQ